MKNLRDKIEMILEDILGSVNAPGASMLTPKQKDEWKNYYQRQIMQAFKEAIEDELNTMAN